MKLLKLAWLEIIEKIILFLLWLIDLFKDNKN